MTSDDRRVDEIREQYRQHRLCGHWAVGAVGWLLQELEGQDRRIARLRELLAGEMSTNSPRFQVATEAGPTTTWVVWRGKPWVSVDAAIDAAMEGNKRC